MPAWLMNWLAEGKPLTFVRQLEEVAAKWDEQASRSRTMPCKGRGFGESWLGWIAFRSVCVCFFPSHLVE